MLGPPGAGKGTHGTHLAQVWGVPHIASGDLLRQAIAQDAESDLARAAGVIGKGEMVSDDAAAQVVLSALASPSAAGGFVLDGYPRNVHQAQVLTDFLAQRGAALDAVLELSVSHETLMERLMGRLTCPNCGETFHIVNAPPRVAGVCDNCGHGLVVRADDQSEAIFTRLRLYAERTAPVADYYRGHGVLRTVCADDTEDIVFPRCLRAAEQTGGAADESLV